MADVRSMCAIGQRGQLGLGGRLPWEGNPGRAYVADVARFFDMTRGHVLMAGAKTIEAVPDWAREHLTVFVLRSTMTPEDAFAKFPGRTIFVGGGPPVWDVYAKYIRHWDITRLPYDGEADRWFDPKWLVAGGG